MKSFMRCSELAHERQKTNLAEPFATKRWSPCMAGYFINWAKNRSFSTQWADFGHSLRAQSDSAKPLEADVQSTLQLGFALRRRMTAKSPL